MPRWIRVWALLGLLLSLSACGGGSPTALLGASSPPRGTEPVAVLGVSISSSPGPALTAEALFDWAQIQFPGFFPGPQSTLQIGVYSYRYFPSSDTYLAVGNGRVYVLGSSSTAGQVIDFGPISQFSCAVYPTSCAPPLADPGVARHVAVGSTVVLDGSASTVPTGTTATFAWTLTQKPAGSQAGLDSPGSALSGFTADQAGTYVASLSVSAGPGWTPSIAQVTITAVVSGTSVASSSVTDHLLIDGVRREFIVFTPSGQVPPARMPVVFMLHGTSGDGARFWTMSGWKETCETEKCIAVFPSSLEFCINDTEGQKRTTKWNGDDLAPIACPGQVLPDDVAFIRGIVERLRRDYPVDEKRIYVSGFSSGATFASKLWAVMSDTFAAVAASAGFLYDATLAPAVPVPYYLTIGNLDDKSPTLQPYVPMPTGASILGTVPPLADIVTDARAALGLSEAYTTETTTGVTTLVYATPASAGTEMRVGVVADMGHTYANGSNNPQGVSYTNLFWPFFSRFAKP